MMADTMHIETHDGQTDWLSKMTVCVGAVILQDKRVLFIRQAEGHSLAGQWSIPWGIVDHEETPEDAVLRETYEESGIKAEVDGLLGIQNLRTPGWLGIVFIGHPLEGIPAPDGVETDRAAYFSREEINSFEEPFEPWCKWLALRILAGACTVTPQEAHNPYYPRNAFL